MRDDLATQISRLCRSGVFRRFHVIERGDGDFDAAYLVSGNSARTHVHRDPVCALRVALGLPVHEVGQGALELAMRRFARSGEFGTLVLIRDRLSGYDASFDWGQVTGRASPVEALRAALDLPPDPDLFGAW